MSYGYPPAQHRGYPPPGPPMNNPFGTPQERQAPDLFHPQARNRGPVQLVQPPPLGKQGMVIANQMLQELAGLLKLDALKFDAKNTCVIDYGGKCTLLITYDVPSERIYVYSTLLTSLPTDVDSKLALYEFLLEGALLGRDMAGGGVGISLRDDFCLMCSSFDVRNSEVDALRILVPSFVASLLEWRQRIGRHPTLAHVLRSGNHSPADLFNAARDHAPVPQSQHAFPASPTASQRFPVAPPPMSPQAGVPRSKALLIGVNYFNTSAELSGCCNDARSIKTFLERNGFDDPANILLLVDDQRDPNFLPTKENILNGVRWLVSDAQPGDSLFFSFSGHGRREQDVGLDEEGQPIFSTALCPLDFQRYGAIPAEELYQQLVAPLPQRLALNAIIDCSGCLFDMALPWVYVVEPQRGEDPAPQLQPTSGGQRGRFLQERANPRPAVCVLASARDTSAKGETMRLPEAFVTSLTRQPVQRYQQLAHGILQQFTAGSRTYLALFSTSLMNLRTTYTL
eukprot:TRINITY_DN2472_c0_g1_i1.p1 TRINITY_DN2472_c0_g1~~TRINITY_DN2472_c0_g1_i1.p1  ORF type:complete len:520 (+),score=93.45 TRINITY_DN2472_c0_g1_i1:27-1562(+)